MTSRLQSKLLAQRALFQRLQSSKKRSKLQAGFTLIELLIVVIIIGVLSSLALPAFLNQADKAREETAKSAAASAARACLVQRALTGVENQAAEAPATGNCGDGGTVSYPTSEGWTGTQLISSGGALTQPPTATKDQQ
jgi:type IV pilus assembly protein PilA